MEFILSKVEGIEMNIQSILIETKTGSYIISLYKIY